MDNREKAEVIAKAYAYSSQALQNEQDFYRTNPGRMIEPDDIYPTGDEQIPQKLWDKARIVGSEAVTKLLPVVGDNITLEFGEEVSLKRGLQLLGYAITDVEWGEIHYAEAFSSFGLPQQKIDELYRISREITG